VKDFQAIAGRGVKAHLEQDEIKIGGTAILDNKTLPSQLEKEIQQENKKGKTIIYVLRNDQVIGIYFTGRCDKGRVKRGSKKFKRDGS